MQKRLGSIPIQNVNVSRMGRKIFFNCDVMDDSAYELIRILNEIEEEDNESWCQGNAEVALNEIVNVLESENDEITKNESKHINEMINTYKKNIKKPNSLDREPIHLYMNSRGGDAYECLGIIDTINNMKTPVWGYTYKAMSAGFLIYIACDRRFMYQNGTLLYHQGSSWVSGALQSMIEDVEETMRLQEMIENLTLDCTCISSERLDEVREKKIDWYINSETALDLGICDEII